MSPSASSLNITHSLAYLFLLTFYLVCVLELAKIMFLSKYHRLFKQKTKALLLAFVFLLITSVMTNTDHPYSNPFVTHTHSNMHYYYYYSSALGKMIYDGHLSFENLEHAAKDFGNMYSFTPSAVLYPNSVSDISSTIKYIYDIGINSDVTVSARGLGHSLQGQAQTYRGVVVNMESLREHAEMRFCTGKNPYVDVSAGELWINVLHESLKLGLAPKSWTDYLHLTVGGTLSNAGISGQAFKHGPQINNVYQLQVVTGRGEVVTCSEDQSSDLFHAVLGGLGQFGVITEARIALEPALRMVKWIRVLYTDFTVFANDQERLISSSNAFDYVEGFVIINRTGLLNNWRSSFNPRDPIQATKFTSEEKILFCIEIAKYFNPEEANDIDEEVDRLLSRLNYISSTLFQQEVSFIDFLDRVHVSEMKLREKGLWDVPHPWLNLLVPRRSIHEFANQVFGSIVKDTSNGPVLIYPVNKSRWINGTSLITPDEDVFYLVGFLSSALPNSRDKDGLEHILLQNNKIWNYIEKPHLGIKQYLPHYSTQQEWKFHFGNHWEVFSRRKLNYDPLAILATGQRIFERVKSFGQH